MKLTETENDRTSIETDGVSRQEAGGKALKLPKIGVRDFAWKVGEQTPNVVGFERGNYLKVPERARQENGSGSREIGPRINLR